MDRSNYHTNNLELKKVVKCKRSALKCPQVSSCIEAVSRSAGENLPVNIQVFLAWK
jgi:hypothetical protein